MKCWLTLLLVINTRLEFAFIVGVILKTNTWLMTNSFVIMQITIAR